MASSDPTQFSPTPAAAQNNAVARRLGGVDSNGVPLPMAPVPTGTLQGPAAPTPAPQPAPPKPLPNPLIGGTGDKNLDTYLGTDATYQTQLSQLMKQLDLFNSQQGLSASQTQADYDAKIRSLNDQSTQDRLNMRNADASRGILFSGIYANQLGQYNDANQQQMTNLLGGLQNTKDSAQLAYQQEIAQLQSAKEQAIQQAAARRAASLGSF